MELRYATDSNGGVQNIEVCVNDRWWNVVVSDGIKADISKTAHDFTLEVLTVHFTSVTITWSMQSMVYSKLSVNGYDISCTAVFEGGIYEAKVPSVDINTDTIEVNGLMSDTMYNCCVTAHIQVNLPIDLISSTCVTSKTLSDLENTNIVVVILGTCLCVCSLLLLGICAGLVIKASVMKRNSVTNE